VHALVMNEPSPGPDRTEVRELPDPRPGTGQVSIDVAYAGINFIDVMARRRSSIQLPPTDGWGQVPAWGLLRAVGSCDPEVKAGSRASGLCPMSTHLVMHPDRVGSAGFRDASAQRAGASPVYNAYLWKPTSSAGSRLDDLLVVLRPVFWLSFTLDDYLAEHYPSARTVVLTSASSKAASGLSHLLRQRAVSTVGLTSASQASYLEGLSVYDRVFVCDQLDRPPASRSKSRGLCRPNRRPVSGSALPTGSAPSQPCWWPAILTGPATPRSWTS
jgi:NADPH:quinone reductase-like Zn-dependent oxidoreductase